MFFFFLYHLVRQAVLEKALKTGSLEAAERVIAFRAGEAAYVANEVATIEAQVLDFLRTSDGEEVLDTQAQIAWAAEHQLVRSINVRRHPDSMAQSLGLQAEVCSRLQLHVTDTQSIHISNASLRVLGLSLSSPLSGFGIQAGDVILAVNGEPFPDLATFAELVRLRQCVFCHCNGQQIVVVSLLLLSVVVVVVVVVVVLVPFPNK